MKLNQIICGDCLNVMGNIPNNSVNLVVTSPPYNKRSSGRKFSKRDNWSKANIDYGYYKDDMPEEEYQKWQKEVLRECIRIIKRDGSIFYNHKPRIINQSVIFPQEWLGEFIVRQMIVWNRKNSPIINPIRFLPTTEYIFWITKENRTPKFNGEFLSLGEVWDISPVICEYHPATFPKGVVKRCILATTNENDIVLDPFLGSGTTAMASKKLGFNYIGIEQSEEYVRIARSRIKAIREDLTLF